MKPVAIAGFIPDRDVRKLLEQRDLDLTLVRSCQALCSHAYPRHPRLFLVQLMPEATEPTLETVRELRRQRPLTDVVVWAPQAGSAAVRQFFLAGAKDVALTRSGRALIEIVEEILTAQQIQPRLERLAGGRNRGTRFESMLSRSGVMWDLFELCSQIAPAQATVLIEGETGTGKELLARAIHRLSGRGGRFVAANCASLPPELINSELFGHEKGSFTGADRAKTGLVRYANQGTLFLDEIGDMDGEAQQSLLRMLQEKSIRPVGGLSEIAVDVRVVAATHVPLERAVAARKFREDLYYRLDVIRMNVPPLRERREDILFLFGHFAKQMSRQYGLDPPTYTDGFLDALVGYRWPGNVRQLRNFTERLILSRPPKALSVDDVNRLLNHSWNSADSRNSASPRWPARQEPRIETDKTLQENLDPIVEIREREYLEAVLAQNRGRIGRAAEQAGISRRTLLRKIQRFQLDKNAFKEDPGTKSD